MICTSYAARVRRLDIHTPIVLCTVTASSLAHSSGLQHLYHSLPRRPLCRSKEMPNSQ